MVSALLSVNLTTRPSLKAKKYLLCQWGEHRVGILAQELGDSKAAGDIAGGIAEQTGSAKAKSGPAGKGFNCEARFWDWKLGPAKTHYL
jgi:hypothetical protein